MTNEQIKYAISKHRFKPKNSELLGYYKVSAITTVVFVIGIIMTLIFNPNEEKDYFVVKLATVFLLFGAVSFYLQYKNLKFQVFNTNLNKKEIYVQLKQMSEKYKWNFVEQRFENSSNNPSQFLGGEICTAPNLIYGQHQIRIVIDNNKVLINVTSSHYETNIPISSIGILKWKPSKIMDEIKNLL